MSIRRGTSDPDTVEVHSRELTPVFGVATSTKRRSDGQGLAPRFVRFRRFNTSMLRITKHFSAGIPFCFVMPRQRVTSEYGALPLLSEFYITAPVHCLVQPCPGSASLYQAVALSGCTLPRCTQPSPLIAIRCPSLTLFCHCQTWSCHAAPLLNTAVLCLSCTLTRIAMPLHTPRSNTLPPHDLDGLCPSFVMRCYAVTKHCSQRSAQAFRWKAVCCHADALPNYPLPVLGASVRYWTVPRPHNSVLCLC